MTFVVERVIAAVVKVIDNIRYFLYNNNNTTNNR